MNKAIIYLPISFLILISILYISLSVPSFSLTIHFSRLIYLSIFLSILTASIVYFKFKNTYDFENIYTLTGSTLACSFVLWFALILLINSQYTTKRCNISSYKIVGYTGRYTSGLGNIEKKKLKANQWILTIIKEEKEERFVLDKDISSDNRVTKMMDLQFCKGILGTEYLHIEQIP